MNSMFEIQNLYSHLSIQMSQVNINEWISSIFLLRSYEIENVVAISLDNTSQAIIYLVQCNNQSYIARINQYSME